MNKLLADATLKPIVGVNGPGGFNPNSAGNYQDAPEKLAGLISVAIGGITFFAGLSFLFYFILGAVQWMTAGGDKQQVSTARDKITTSMIGLVLVIVAYALTGIIGSIFGLDILNLSRSFCLINNPPASCP